MSATPLDRPEEKVRTYSAYSRGLDVLIGAHHYLDLTPLGRNEDGDGKDWVKYHDRYEEGEGKSCCGSH